METSLLSRNKKSKYRCWSWEDNDGFSVISLCFLALSICISVALVVKIYFGEPEIIPQGAVTSDNKNCSQVGVDVLKQGGNAVDAAIASTLCMGVMHPHITGIGGGGVMIIHSYKTGKTPTKVTFREQSPAKVQRVPENSFGPTTVGIPGLLRGLQVAHNKFGSAQWSSLLNPSIKMAFDGISVSQQMADALQELPKESPLRQTDNIFYRAQIPLAEGEVLRNSKLGLLLSKVADKGAEVFYSGEAGSSLLSQMNLEGMTWSPSDLSGYVADVELAMQGLFRNKTLYTSGAPSLGPQLLSLMNILEGFNFTQQDLRTPAFYHLLTEAIRITQAQASHLGDQRFNAEVNNIAMQMNNKTLSRDVRIQLSNSTLLPADTAIPVVPEPIGSVVSVIDSNENYVTIVSGLNTKFGSQVLAEDGYLLNNALANFYPPSFNRSANNLEPGKRPLQPYVPLIAIESGRRCGLRLATGSADPTQLAQVIHNLFQFDWSVQDAVQSARLHAAIQNTQVGIEDNLKSKIPEDILAQLVAMGHAITKVDQPYCSVNAIRKTGDTLASQADSRGGGYAIKYGP